MREIKFRAWDEYRKCMQLPLSDEGRWFDGVVGAMSSHLNSDGWYDMPLMQYTGLKDKNGVEIYEGDILAFYSTDGQRVTKRQIVKWEQSKLGFNFSQKPTVEVIGNIYEDPELLEVGQ